MKFTANRDDLAYALGLVTNVVSSRGTMPVLSNVQITASAAGLTLHTTNLDQSIECPLSAQVEEPGTFTLPAHRLLSMVQRLPKFEAILSVPPKMLTAILSSGTSHFTLNGIPSEEFPSWREFTSEPVFTVAPFALAELIRSVAFASSTDETRYILNGVFFQLEGGQLRLTATDGRRLAAITKELPAVKACEFILPSQSIKLLLDLLADPGDALVQVQFIEDLPLCSFAIANAQLARTVRLSSKTVQGTYPNYRQVLPKKPTRAKIILERLPFLETLQRMTTACTERVFSVLLKLTDGQLALSAGVAEFTAKETLAVDYAGEEITVAVNVHFLIDLLQSLTQGMLDLGMDAHDQPVVVQAGSSFTYVLMPVRLE